MRRRKVRMGRTRKEWSAHAQAAFVYVRASACALVFISRPFAPWLRTGTVNKAASLSLIAHQRKKK